MTKVDGATMHYALEARSPLLDQEIWNFAAALPHDVRLHGGRLKAILRELAARKIGRPTAKGKKRGFTIPVQRWMAGRWRETEEEAFNNSLLATEGWIHKAPAVLQFRRAVEMGSAPIELWCLFALEIWLRHERSAVAARIQPRT